MATFEQAVILAINKSAKKVQIRQTFVGVATNVRETICNVEREDAPTLLDCRLNAIDDDLQSFVTIYPKAGSNVIVGVIENLKSEFVVLRCSEVDKVKLKIGEQTLLINKDGFVFNNGTLDGLVKLGAILEKINRLEDKLKTHQHAYIPYPEGVAATPVSTTPATSATPPNNTLVFTNTSKAELENTKIKQ
ncbi:MAG: hypothetical protein FWC39_07985 [Bacteroidetes bacterium]|nr:hypothetical protein [Bacteroidota bacterium]